MPRGGRREGAGRKRSTVKALPAPDKCIATRVLAKLDEEREWEKLLRWTDVDDAQVRQIFAGNPSLIVALLKERRETLLRLIERRDGKPVQAVQHSGEIGLKHLSDEELNAKLAQLMKELAK